jgi:hypothetical protein
MLTVLSVNVIEGFINAIFSESHFTEGCVWNLADEAMSVIYYIWSESCICKIWKIQEWLSSVNLRLTGRCLRSKDKQIKSSRLVGG